MNNSISMSGYEQEYNEMKMILRGIAHEMGNALTVMGYSIKSVGKRNNINGDENWEYLNEDFDYICRLFKNLSAYNNRKDLNIVELKLDKLVMSVISVLYDEYAYEGIEIKFDGIRNAVILGDEIKLKQVLINIIKNAYEAIKIKKESDIHDENNINGIIEIGITEDEDVYKLTIKDNGCGIDKENICKIFEPMYTEKSGGTGLGLPVCKGIIENHGGNISVVSTKNVGSEFVITLKK